MLGTFRGRVPLGAVEEGSPKRIVHFGNGRNGAMRSLQRSYLETEVTDRQFLMLPRGRASTSIDQCAPRTRQDDRRPLESVCGQLIFRATDAPDRDLCHRCTDRRLWLARDHDRVQADLRRVTARKLRVCQADKALFRLRENDEPRP
jgi:hypothetical protein